ncbi:MAG TPA: PKD domain-containing protein [Candidatus Dormibacteraeota bacterium]|nr:PKD domain-containing protein [Candidatus Dormibacteraeota bacterium]
MKNAMIRLRRHSAPRILVLTLFVTMLAMGIVTASQLSRLASGQSTTTPQTGMATGAYFDHTVIIIMEDHGIQDVCAQNPPPCLGSNGDPYMASLANNYAIGSQYLGVNHFSQANYLALLGGDTFGCGNNGCPPVSNPNLVDRLEAAGLTWKGYMENQNVASGCDNTYHEPYTLEHNPFVGFTDILNNPTRCSNIVLANPTGCTVTDCSLVNDLNSASAPNFMWLTPNNCNNMHGFTGICPTSIPMGDNYLKGLVPNILNSNTFTTQRAALFIVFDEGNGWCPLNGSSEDCVYAVWAGPLAKTGFATSNLYNHYSWTKTIETNWNLAGLTSNDANAKPMTEFFKSSTPPVLLSTSFTYSPSSPQVSQQVSFTASAAGGTAPYTFSWAFGDGATGTGAAVYHTYSTTGSYSVVLTAKDSSPSQQTATSQQTITVTSPPPPPSLTASFTESLSNSVVGQTVSFTGSASGGTAPYNYAWNFGDSSTGSGSSASHVYQTAGVYTVVLTVTDAAGQVASATNTVTVTLPLSASFTYSPSNPAPLTNIQFTATATGGTAPYNYSWDFGDGTTGTGAAATHSYLLPGTYTVSLTVVDANGLTTTASTTVTVAISLGL